MSDEYLTYQIVAVRFDVHVRTVARWFKPYELFHKANTVRIPISVYNEFLDHYTAIQTRASKRSGPRTKKAVLACKKERK